MKIKAIVNPETPSETLSSSLDTRDKIPKTKLVIIIEIFPIKIIGFLPKCFPNSPETNPIANNKAPLIKVRLFADY